MSILDFWPDATKKPREIQLKALAWLEQQKSKYIIMELPVGSGKSLLGITYSKFLNQGTGDAFVCTPQRALQRQYESDFQANPSSNLVGFYGKSNYTCLEKNTNCNTGGLIKPKCGNCTHKLAKQKAISASNVVLNYDLALLQFNKVNDFPNRQLLICDEGHSLEALLCEYDAAHISKTRMEQVQVKWKYMTDIEDAYNWTTQTYLPALRATVASMKDEVDPLLEEKHLSPDDIDLIKEYQDLADHLDRINEVNLVSIDELKEKWVLVHDKMNIKFKRLHASEIFNKYLGKIASKTMIMSSTIPNPQQFCKDLGIPWGEVSFISLPSEFPKDNRKVVAIPHMKMNYEWDKPHNEKSRKEMIGGIETICNLHSKEKGIIHTANFSISEWLVDKLNVTHQIFHHNPDSGDDRNSVIDAFMKSTQPSILISPSITEGLDLKNDLARFGIIVKAPYPYMGDQWIKARMELSSDWYQRQTIIQVIQASGRIVRSAEDYGTTYILDGSWPYLYKSQFANIPKWWRDAYSVL